MYKYISEDEAVTIGQDIKSVKKRIVEALRKYAKHKSGVPFLNPNKNNGITSLFLINESGSEELYYGKEFEEGIIINPISNLSLNELCALFMTTAQEEPWATTTTHPRPFQ